MNYDRPTLDHARKEIRCLLRRVGDDEWPMLCPRSEHLARRLDAASAQALYEEMIADAERDLGRSIFLQPARVTEDGGAFLCPECGSGEPGAVLAVLPHVVPNFAEPWSRVWEKILCAECDAAIPAHLAERWGGRSIADARSEWHELFRPLPIPVA